MADALKRHERVNAFNLVNYRHVSEHVDNSPLRNLRINVGLTGSTSVIGLQ